MKKIALITILASALLLMACDDEPDAAADEPTQDHAQEEIVEEEPQDDQSDDEAEADAPRTAETATPDDDAIGELPEGLGIAVGESAPDTTAQTEDGEDVQILELVEDEGIVLFFYRGGWCPFCNFQIREMTQAADDFAEKGYRPVAISVDQPDAAMDTSEAYEIPYPVLSDPDLVAHEAFNVIYEADDDEVAQLAEGGMDLEAHSGRDHHSFAVPSVFIIDADGEVLWAHANMDYSIRPSPQQLLSVLDDLQGQ